MTTKRFFKHIFLVTLILLAFVNWCISEPINNNPEAVPKWISSGTAIPIKQLTHSDYQYLTNWIKTNGMQPEDYVVSKFKQHDVVILGEIHKIKQYVEFVGDLIPILHKVGINVLATEFARREDQNLIDKLLQADEYDEKLARQIQFNKNVNWSYQEYINIFKSAWQVNHNLTNGEKHFRILGINDSPNWSILKKEEDWNNNALRQAVWGKESGEDRWAKVVLDEVARGEKVLLYCGSNHAFTKYLQPIYNHSTGDLKRFGTERTGNYLHKALGEKVFMIFFHAPMEAKVGSEKPFVYPLNGLIDRMLLAMPSTNRRIAFNTQHTPLGLLIDDRTIYSYGYKDFRLELLCDGYICLVPITEFQEVHTINDFINANNIKEARQRTSDLELRNATPEEFYQWALDNTDIPQHLLQSLEQLPPAEYKQNTPDTDAK